MAGRGAGWLREGLDPGDWRRPRCLARRAGPGRGGPGSAACLQGHRAIPPCRPTKCRTSSAVGLQPDRRADVLGPFAAMGHTPALLVGRAVRVWREGTPDRTGRCRPSPSPRPRRPKYVSGVIFIVLLASSQIGISPLLVEMGAGLTAAQLFLGSARSATGPRSRSGTSPLRGPDHTRLYGMGLHRGG